MTNNLITNAEQVTEQWLDAVLRENGSMPQGSITSFSKSVSKPFMSPVVWIKATYDDRVPPNLPTAFLLKIDGPGSLAGGREAEFYTEYALQHGVEITAPYFDADYDPTQGAYHLLLADMTATHYAAEVESPPTQAEAERIMDTLAILHSRWWDQLPSQIGFIDDELLGDLQFDFAGFADFIGGRLIKDRLAIYERILAVLPGLLRERLMRGQGQTLVHDDAHPWNFLQPRDPSQGRALLIDWQQWGRSIGLHDVAKQISLFWYPEQRSRLERPMVERYFARLQEHGVSGYSWDQCWNDYRLFILRNMLVPLWAWQRGHWAPHRWMQIEKSMGAFTDLCCWELLE